jgi:hypothetical protein
VNALPKKLAEGISSALMNFAFQLDRPQRVCIRPFLAEQVFRKPCMSCVLQSSGRDAVSTAGDFSRKSMHQNRF